MSTLPANPSYSTDVPTVSYPGESESSSKNDPNSPQALMRKTKEMEVQSVVDSKYDSNVPAHEGFQCGCKSRMLFDLIVFCGLLALLAFVIPKRMQAFRLGILILLALLITALALLASGFA